MLKDKRGSVFIEVLFTMPILIMVFVFIFEMGCIMYDWIGINYIANKTAVNAAIDGRLSDDIRQKAEDEIRGWTTEGKNVSFDRNAVSSYNAAGTVVIYGTDPTMVVSRGDEIEIGIVYPIRFKNFVVDAMGTWLINQHDFTLKARAVTISEKYF